MSQHPVDTLRLFYEAASRDDLDAVSELVAPDVELVPPNRSPDSAPVKGKMSKLGGQTSERPSATCRSRWRSSSRPRSSSSLSFGSGFAPTVRMPSSSCGLLICGRCAMGS
jgi:hypothetical protein